MVRQNDVTVLVCWLKCILKTAAFAWSLFKTQKGNKEKAAGTFAGCGGFSSPTSLQNKLVALLGQLTQLPFLPLGLYQ